MFFLVVFLFVILFLLLISMVRIVPQASAYIVERLGKYHDTWNAGPHLPVL